MRAKYKDAFKRASQGFPDKPAVVTNSLSVPFESKKSAADKHSWGQS